MASLKRLAACIGLGPRFFVVGDFFGYRSAPPWNLAPSQTGLPQSLSLATQMKRLQQTHVHLNLITVGASAADKQNLDSAVQVTRDIYASFGIGIGRVQHWFIPAESGYAVISDDCEAEDLVDEYGIGNG